MGNDLALAAFTLQRGYSLVLVKKGKVLAVKGGRGIRPLLELIEKDKEKLKGACLGDKVVGRAAAYLAAYAGLAGVYTHIISKPACEIFLNYRIKVAYGHQVTTILNRQRTDLCPMEALAATFTSPGEAPEKIKAKLRELQQGKKEIIKRGQQ